ncbi:MAG TPA: hypothetical protein GX733_03640 [Tissierellia bacterium]|jgi:hypothetical protein|nr:hypothetical protein [Tissierellia bacterium]
MKHRGLILGFVLISLLAFFLWVVFSNGKEPASPSPTQPASEVKTNPDDVIDQEQPEIAVPSAHHLIERNGYVYVGEEASQVNWEDNTVTVSSQPVDIGYNKDDLFYGLSGKDLVQVRGEETIVLAEGVSDIRYLKSHILYLDSEGVHLLSVGRNTIQRLLENTEERPLTSLDRIELSKGTEYYVIADDTQNNFEIYINESKELLSIVEGKFLSASPIDALVAYGEADQPTRLGVFYIETSTDTQMHLTSEGEEVVTSPAFDERGDILYLSKREGILYVNTIVLETKQRNRVQLEEADKFVKEFWVDGYYVIGFKDRFYYGQDPQTLSYYELPFDQIRFSGEDIFVTEGSTLRVIRKNQYKEYSLKGIPVELLPVGEYFYYTYNVGTKPFISRIKIQF